MWKQFVGEFSGCRAGCQCSPGYAPRGKKESLQGFGVGKNTDKRDVSSEELLEPEEFLRERGKIWTKGGLGPGKIPEDVGQTINHPDPPGSATAPSGTEIKLPRSRPETGAKSARRRPPARERTAEAVNRSLFCFNYFSVVREMRRRGGTRGVKFRTAESCSGALGCEAAPVCVNGANPQTHFISLFCPFYCVLFFYVLSLFANGACSPVPGWMLPWVTVGAAYGLNSGLGQAGLSPKPKPFQNAIKNLPQIP